MATTIITQPTEEPVTLKEAKAQVRERSIDYDIEIQNLITEGRRYVEQHTGRALCTQTWNLVLDAMPTRIDMPYPPLQSVSSVSYQDLDNSTQTLATTNYTVDTGSTPGRLNQAYGGTYPATYPDLNAVTIQFVCGYGGREDVPDRFKQAIKLYVQWKFDQDMVAKNELHDMILQDKVNWFAPDA